jgi:hypothetical protein
MSSEHIREERLALCASGDLSDIEQHLSGCAVCQQVLAEFEQTRELLANSRCEPAEEDLQEVRTRVMSRLEKQARTEHRLRWSAGVAAAAAIFALCLFHLNPSQPTTVSLPSAPRRPMPPATEQIARSAPDAKRKTIHVHCVETPGLRSVALIARADGTSLIKMTTTDPNVVILLPSEERTKLNE